MDVRDEKGSMGNDGRDMREELFYRLVNTPSTTNNGEEERQMAQVIDDILREQSYFKKHDAFRGLKRIEGDGLKRTIPWGLHMAGEKTVATVVLMGHLDTVSVDNYGDLAPLARNPQALAEQLCKLTPSPEISRDLDSGQWIFGRGTADMKGGLSVLIGEFIRILEEDDVNVNVLFFAVPDEETYSAGMRGVTSLLQELKEMYHLRYQLMITSESHLRQFDGQAEGESGRIPYFDGTIGKLLVNVVVRGVPKHSRYYYAGYNPVLLASHIVSLIDGEAALTEKSGDEKTPPPCCMYFRDTKKNYDVTLPQSVDLSFSCLMHRRSPAEVVEQIRGQVQQAVNRTDEYLRQSYGAWSADYPSAVKDYRGAVKVSTYEELLARGEKQGGNRFLSRYVELKEQIAEENRTGKRSFADATLAMIHGVLDDLDVEQPTVVIALSPPFYPGFTDEEILTEDHWACKLPERLRKFSRETLGLDVFFEHYFSGISDMSYAATTYSQKESDFISANMPLWGRPYSVDFAAIRSLQIPVLNVGPWGKDIHTQWERVNRTSLFEECGKQIQFLLKQYGED